MKNVSTKIAYMVIGSLLTIIGYHFGNIDNNAAEAEKEDRPPMGFRIGAERDDPIADEIRVRRLVIVGEDDTPHIVADTHRVVEVRKGDNTSRIETAIVIGKKGGQQLLLHPDGIHRSVPIEIEEGSMLYKKGDKLPPFDSGDIVKKSGSIVIVNRNNKIGGRIVGELPPNENFIRFIGENTWIELSNGTRYTCKTEKCIIDMETHTISEGEISVSYKDRK